MLPLFNQYCRILLFYCRCISLVIWAINVMQRNLDIGDAVYQLNWYVLPLHLQKKLSTIIEITQKNIYIRGFAGFNCTCNIFSQVISMFRNNIKTYPKESLKIFFNNISRLCRKHFRTLHFCGSWTLRMASKLLHRLRLFMYLVKH